jgi:hypothetical protein
MSTDPTTPTGDVPAPPTPDPTVPVMDIPPAAIAYLMRHHSNVYEHTQRIRAVQIMETVQYHGETIPAGTYLTITPQLEPLLIPRAEFEAQWTPSSFTPANESGLLLP